VTASRMNGWGQAYQSIFGAAKFYIEIKYVNSSINLFLLKILPTSYP